VAIAIPTDDAWHRFCKAADQPSWIEDNRFSDAENRRRNQAELDRLIGEWTMRHEAHDIMHLLQQADIPAGPVLDASELLADPHLNERGFFETVTHPEAGTHPYIGMYAIFSKTPGSIRKPAPCLGEHNDYVFKELLGLSKEDVDRLEKEGVIGTVADEEQQGTMY
jgi:crotonobetainyl-CoA:carnitine CoA-transferase CaiB-like acyl-CoA transferase